MFIYPFKQIKISKIINSAECAISIEKKNKKNFEQ